MRGCKFRRQHGIEKYIVDFYCPELMLAIEVDGPYHLSQKAYDARRQKQIEAHGVRFLRFTSDDVMFEEGKVLEAIAAEVDRLRRATSTPVPSSERRGGEKHERSEIKSGASQHF